LTEIEKLILNKKMLTGKDIDGSDIMDKLDVILKEVVASREERVIVADRLSKHEDRITSLEKTVATV
jgi:hypothetical protein